MAKFDDIITNKGERTFRQVALSSGVRIQTSEVRPGHFYSFMVLMPNLNESKIPKSKEEWKEHPENFVTEKQYVDLNPCGMLLYHDRWKETALLLNLKVLPPRKRVTLLRAFHALTEKYIDKLYKDDKLLPFNEREKMIMPFYGITLNMLQDLTNINLGYSINKYNMTDIRNVVFLDWNKFGELPFAKVDEYGVFVAPNYTTIADIFEQFDEKQN